MTNDRRSRRRADSLAARSELLFQGVWETYAEASAAKSHASFERDIETPFTIFQDSEAHPNGLQLILVVLAVTLAVKSIGECLDLHYAEVELCTRGLDPFTAITGPPDARVDHEKLNCYLSQLRWKKKLPEPDCYCGGAGRLGEVEPTCPDWLPPKKRGPRDWW